MSEQPLECVEIDPGLEHVGCEGVTKQMDPTGLVLTISLARRPAE